MKKLITKVKSSKLFTTEKGLYLVFGGLTTLVSILAFWISDLFFGAEYITLSTVIKNIAGIIFAYITNRIYVFKSKNTSSKAKVQEFVLFVITRVATLFVDIWLIGLLTVNAGIHQNIGTVITSVVVIVLNYVASKLYIFTPKDKED